MHKDPRNRVVLLVEDSADDEELTKRALERAHLANPIVVAHDGVEALDWLFREGSQAVRDPGLRPEIVLLDLKLPRLDGHGVLKRMRQDPRTRGVPVVVLTSSRQDEDIVRSYDLGANSYVRKPVDFDQFQEAVRQLGLYWLVLNESPSAR